MTITSSGTSRARRYRFGATIWTWREACGDAHMYARLAMVSSPWFTAFSRWTARPTRSNGPRTALVDVMQKMTVRFAPAHWARSIGHRTIARSTRRRRCPRRQAPRGLRADGRRLVGEDRPSRLGRIESMPWFGGTLFHAARHRRPLVDPHDAMSTAPPTSAEASVRSEPPRFSRQGGGDPTRGARSRAGPPRRRAFARRRIGR